ncbi:hypothetical protein [Amycolatopsis jejuensis]|uniref:hypothetical protein n=1 Tax=Amycolatopsis jejuensis TaxID=330084 RepID=UPI00068C56CB|nr:hypothetical protein [Amycolatopsis jejuensis]
MRGQVHVDHAQYVGEAGFPTLLTLACWADPVPFERWFAETRPAWLGGAAGYVAEVVQPTVSRFETLYSDDRRTGIGTLGTDLSGEIAPLRPGLERNERRRFLEEVEPILRAGMTFLRDDGCSVGPVRPPARRRRQSGGQEFRAELVAEYRRPRPATTPPASRFSARR